MESRFFVNDEWYVSILDAASFSGYNKDYIARLCRQGKLLGKMIGRSWYLSEESLNTFIHEQTLSKKQYASLLAEERKKEYQKNIQYAKVGTYPTLGGNGLVQETVVSSADRTQTIEVFFSLKKFLGPLNVFGYGVYVSLAIFSLVVFTPIFLINTSHQNKVTSFEANVSSEYIVSVPELLARFVYRFITDSMSIPIAIFSPTNGTYAVVQEPEAHVRMFESGKLFNTTGKGMAVFPSTGNYAKDYENKKNIQDNFSDRVEVFPEPDELSGVIKPVFRSIAADNYLYVLVPVDNNSPP